MTPSEEALELLQKMKATDLDGLRLVAIDSALTLAHAKGMEDGAVIAAEYGDANWTAYKRGKSPQRGDVYIQGKADAGSEIADAIRRKAGESPHD